MIRETYIGGNSNQSRVLGGRELSAECLGATEELERLCLEAKIEMTNAMRKYHMNVKMCEGLKTYNFQDRCEG